MVNDITGHTEAKPEADNYFTPISPESTMKLHKPRPQLKLNRSNQKEPVNQKGSSLLEILHGGAPRSVANMQDLEKCGKVHSVEELEAQLRRPTKSANKEDEMAAFKKLLTSAAAQMNKPRIPPSFLFSANAYKANNLLQVINKNAHANKISSEMKKDNNASFSGYQQHQQHQQNQQNFSANNMDSQMQIPQDLVMKLLHIQQLQHQQQQQLKQQQQQQFAKLLGSSCNTAARLTPVAPQYNSQSSASPLPPDVQMIINNAKPTPELLQRPEAQALIVGLRRGQISMYNLIEQLKKNPALQPRHREVLASIVKIHQLQTGGNGGNTERTASPVMPAPTTSSASDQMLHKVLFSQHQLRGPSPHNTNMQRVPSPRDLVAHTQNIMQTALIRKKLEEQRDNFRKRQEMQRQAVHYF
ncbi:basic-leucine zipper transcription factor A isoform X2 [Nilaparvata lugens]|uniref:basic-leucine zipper transcription factor A isoform X2 n=1 Tax=Nilaparvata lugens TaxID=108931 RepID=UPI00193E6C69|nr:basic-leucine zipper transcription factor A isoform X2 [Nilaparvata lugens]